MTKLNPGESTDLTDGARVERFRTGDDYMVTADGHVYLTRDGIRELAQAAGFEVTDR